MLGVAFGYVDANLEAGCQNDPVQGALNLWQYALLLGIVGVIGPADTGHYSTVAFSWITNKKYFGFLSWMDGL